MDGFTLCREWKADKDLNQAPFVFYTATYTDPRDEKLAVDIGADAFLVKPLEADEHVARIGDILESHEGKNPAVPHDPGETDESILKNYNEALIRKLEQKMFELERMNAELEAEIAEKNRIEASLRESEELFKNMFHQHTPYS
jgi:DNA-binding response OmpR family regulator